MQESLRRAPNARIPTYGDTRLPYGETPGLPYGETRGSHTEKPGAPVRRNPGLYSIVCVVYLLSYRVYRIVCVVYSFVWIVCVVYSFVWY